MVLRLLGLCLLLCAAAVAVVPTHTSAQLLDNNEPFTVSISPQYPRPFSRVVLTPTSGALSLAGATMTVLVGGKQTYQGPSQAITVSLGAAGTLTPVKVTMTVGGKTYSKTLSLQPQDVVVIAEPISSAPALYPGKPLTPVDGDVRVVAVANMKTSVGKSLPSASLVYSWTVDNTKINASSGIGRNTIVVASPLQYRNREVSVSVQSQDGALVGGASLSLAPAEPVVRIYRNDPLLGILYDHALSNSYRIEGSESSLVGVPYSFSTSDGAPLLQWFLNGSAAQTGATLTLRPTGAGTGTASLSLTASAHETVTAHTSLSISFGAASQGSSFFGL